MADKEQRSNTKQGGATRVPGVNRPPKQLPIDNSPPKKK
jgi:hypothetical protein